jgi:hypothetical protein
MAGTRVTVAQVGTTPAVSGTRAFAFGICDLAPRQLRAIVVSEPATRSHSQRHRRACKTTFRAHDDECKFARAVQQHTDANRASPGAQ